MSLKIKDSTGSIVGILEDDANAPEMLKKIVSKETKTEKEIENVSEETNRD